MDGWESSEESWPVEGVGGSLPGDGCAILDPADLHASPGECPEGGLSAGTGSLGAVATWVGAGYGCRKGKYPHYF